MPSVFSFSKEKKRNLLKNGLVGVFPDTCSSQHGAVDLDYIPFMSPLEFTLTLFIIKHPLCFAMKQKTGYNPFGLSTAPQIARFCYMILLCFP